MGDTVITTAALNSVRKELDRSTQVDSSQVHMLAPAPWCILLQSHASIDRLWVLEKSAGFLTRCWKQWRLVRELRKEKFDAVIALHASKSTAWIARLIGAKVRSIHFHGIHDTNLFSNVKIAGKGEIKPIVDRDLDAVKAVFPEAERATTSIDLPERALAEAKKIMFDAALKGPLLVLGPGASRPAKVWPMDRFCRLAQDWIKKKHGGVIVLAGPDEAHLTEPFQHLPGVHIRQGGDLLVNAAILSRAELYIGNDSGPKHLAVALGVKTLTLFGPESPREWHPYNLTDHPVLYSEKLSCRKALAPGLPEWCSLQVCKEEGHRCMKDISVEQVEALW